MNDVFLENEWFRESLAVHFLGFSLGDPGFVSPRYPSSARHPPLVTVRTFGN